MWAWKTGSFLWINKQRKILRWVRHRVHRVLLKVHHDLPLALVWDDMDMDMPMHTRTLIMPMGMDMDIKRQM